MTEYNPWAWQQEHIYDAADKAPDGNFQWELQTAPKATSYNPWAITDQILAAAQPKITREKKAGSSGGGGGGGGARSASSSSSGGGGSSAPDLSNPVKKDEWARAQGYDGWDEYQLYNKGGGGGGGYSLPEIDIPTVEEYIGTIVDMMPEAPEKYSEVNPFSFDEENAKQLAQAEFGPYYDELLADYLQDTQTTMQRVGDDKTSAVAELEAQEDYFTKTNRRDLDQLLKGIKEGYASRGLYFSGERTHDERFAQDVAQSDLENYLRKTGYKQTGIENQAQRKLEDLTKGARRYERDIGREEKAAVEGNVLQQRGEAVNQYLTGMETYYQNPNWSNLT